MNAIPIGLQMFTLHEESSKDFVGTLKKVAEIGYQGVEFAGYGDLTAKELKKVLDDLELKAASSHVPLTTLELDLELDQVIEYQHEIGSKHLVCPFLLPNRRREQDYDDLIPILNRIGKKCYEEGITFVYHNHDFELVPLSNGKKPLELLFEETNPEWVQTELDIYWLTRAGEDPAEWVKRYNNRTPLIHLKDMTTDGEKFFAELGTGGVDLDGVLRQGSESNTKWWIVEQDQSKRSPFESIQISFDYLQAKLVNESIS
ncbi:sugar phosphate isomerase/epimerase family protein [Oceanobacillus sp. FSL H7-0719]|uniref:sugar phosphate isomerase/epimerase family protein n=1 Tax=Oceanobacillus sp. FSL H7-0719 TaxID=2954507 RepID=UPI003256427A